MKKILTFLIVLLILPLAIHSASSGDVVISELSWSGTIAQSGYEWIELYNPTGSDIDLTGWYIWDSGGIIVDLTTANTTTIGSGAYYLIEYRSTTEPVKQAIADIGSDSEDLGYSKLSNDGENLRLYDSSANLIDQVDCSDGWFAGQSGGVSMEKIILGKDGNDSSNWADNDLITIYGTDYLGNPIYGTPRHPNSVGPTEASINLRAFVYPTRIEVFGGAPETTTVTVKLLDENYSVYTSSPTLDITLSASPTGTGQFSGGTDTIALTLINGEGTVDFGGCLSPGVIEITPENTGVDGIVSADLTVLPIDITGPAPLSMSPSGDFPRVSLSATSFELMLSEEGGIEDTSTLSLWYEIKTSTGVFVDTGTVTLVYSSGADGSEDGIIWGNSLVYKGGADLTKGSTVDIPNLSVIGFWVTGADQKANAISDTGNSVSDYFESITVKDPVILITEVDSIGTYGEDFVEFYMIDDGNNGNGIDLGGFYIDDLDSISTYGTRASITDLDASADKKLSTGIFRTGDYGLLIYDNADDWELPLTKASYFVTTADTGITDSDEQMGIFTPNGELIDLVCWADQGGSLSDDDFEEAFAVGQWNIGYGSPVDGEEIDCVSSDFSKGSIVRDYFNTDTNDKVDWKNTLVVTPGYGHPIDTLPAETDIVISEVYFYSPSGFPDWIELYCKDDGNSGAGVDVGGCFMLTDSVVAIIQPGTTLKTGEFVIITVGNESDSELTAGSDGILTVYLSKLSLSSTDENLELRDFSGNIKDAVVWAERNSEEQIFPFDENGDLIADGQVVPAASTWVVSELIDISYIEYSDFYEVYFSSDPKLGAYHWDGEIYKFFPNMAKYPDYPLGEQPDSGYIYDWIYAATNAIRSNNVDEESSITRDAEFTDTNTLADWTITEEPTMGRPCDETEIPAGNITQIEISPRSFVNDGSDPNRLYTEISLHVVSEGVLTVRVYDVAGREVKTLSEKTVLPPGPFSVKWIGDDNRNRPLPMGVYILYIELRNETKSIYKKEVVAIGKRM
ncbi:lamin tail domain-containing protein [bacterium]|nr:lamin tail domain-containing protein [bacterium]